MRIGIVTDIHQAPPDFPPTGWHNPHQLGTVSERLTRALAWLVDQNVARIVVTGDLTHTGDADSLSTVLGMLAATPVPVWVVPGNHDLITGPAMLTTQLADQDPEGVTMPGGIGEALDHGWHAVGLDLELRDNQAYHATGLSPAVQIPDLPLLVLSHFPVLSVTGPASEAGLKYAGDLANRADLEEALHARIAPSLVICGHLHIRHSQVSGPILQFANSALVESLYEAAVLDLGDWENGRVSWQAVSIDEPWPGVDPGLSPRTQAWAWTSTAWQPAS